MRLLNVHTRLLEEFIGDNVPPYVILSHTWGEQEVSLQDLGRDGHVEKLGYAKIDGCCRVADEKGIAYVWVDTCCIDKTSSSELSEAINSMFRWYQQAEVCCVYLSDVVSGEDPYAEDSSFRKSRWFTRGWTLQELIAPRTIQFFDVSWRSIGVGYSRGSSGHVINAKRNASVTLLSDITRIRWHVLHNGKLDGLAVAEKLAWAAGRQTTRVEDTAYCLLGIVGVNMPLLYGEGPKAFLRLQEQIMSSSYDDSLLAWGFRLPTGSIYDRGTILASSPEKFRGCSNADSHICLGKQKVSHFMMTNRGLNIELPLLLLDKENGLTLALLDCSCLDNDFWFTHDIIAIPLLRSTDMKDVYERLTQNQPIPVPRASLEKAKRRRIYIENSRIAWAPKAPYRYEWEYESRKPFRLLVQFPDFRKETGYDLKEIYPPRALVMIPSNTWQVKWTIIGYPSRYKAFRRVLLLFSHENAMDDEQQRDPILLSIEVGKDPSWGAPNFKIRVVLSKTSALSILEQILSSDRTTTTGSRISREKAHEWRQEYARPPHATATVLVSLRGVDLATISIDSGAS